LLLSVVVKAILWIGVDKLSCCSWLCCFWKRWIVAVENFGVLRKSFQLFHKLFQVSGNECIRCV